MFRSLFWRKLVIVGSCMLVMTMLLPLIISPHIVFAQASVVSINPTQGPAGTKVTGTGTNWTGGDQMQVSWADDGRVLGNTTVQSNGTFTVSFIIPTSAGQGGHNIYFTDLTSRYFLIPVYTVTSLSNVVVQQVWTADSNNNARASFVAGDAIRYMVAAQNMSSTPVTATVTYRVTGPQQIYYWSGSAPLASGLLRFYSAPTIPTNAASGTYTITVTINYNGVSSSAQSHFTVETKASHAIAWAKSQLGSQDWNGQCELFVENAYGTSGQFLTAQAAYVKLHTSANLSPHIGALVWFKPNNGNGNNGHVGIYIGHNQFISATYKGVQINDMSNWGNNVAAYEGWGNAPSSWPGR